MTDKESKRSRSKSPGWNDRAKDRSDSPVRQREARREKRSESPTKRVNISSKSMTMSEADSADSTDNLEAKKPEVLESSPPPQPLPDSKHVVHQKLQSDEEKVKESGSENVLAEDDDEMLAMMGFSGFSSTKNQKVEGNNIGGVSKTKKTAYRQYINREKGSSRPLSPPRRKDP